MERSHPSLLGKAVAVGLVPVAVGGGGAVAADAAGAADVAGLAGVGGLAGNVVVDRLHLCHNHRYDCRENFRDLGHFFVPLFRGHEHLFHRLWISRLHLSPVLLSGGDLCRWPLRASAAWRIPIGVLLGSLVRSLLLVHLRLSK